MPTTVNPAFLRASQVPGGVSLAWGLSFIGTTTPTSFNVYRGTAPGTDPGAPIATGVLPMAYVDLAAPQTGVPLYFTVRGVSVDGISGSSEEVRSAPGQPAWAIPPTPATGAEFAHRGTQVSRPASIPVGPPILLLGVSPSRVALVVQNQGAVDVYIAGSASALTPATPPAPGVGILLKGGQTPPAALTDTTLIGPLWGSVAGAASGPAVVFVAENV